MKKRKTKLLLAILFLFIPFIFSSCIAESIISLVITPVFPNYDKLEYKISKVNGGCCIDYIGTSEAKNIYSIGIPDYINDMKVVKLGDNIFKNFYRLVEIYNLSDIDVKNYISYEYKDIVIHDSIEKYSVVSKTEKYAFALLDDIFYYVGSDSNYYENGVLELPDSFDYNGFKINNYEIRHDVHKNEFIKKVKIPKSVKRIGDRAFSKEDLNNPSKHEEEIDIEYGLNYIGKNAFYKSHFNNIIIPDSVIEIGDGAFEGCQYLTDIKLSKNLDAIRDHTFMDCTLLNNVCIGNNVNKIGIKAFYNCENLENIVLGNKIISIDYEAFYGSNIKNLYYNGTISTWCDIDYDSKSISFIHSDTIFYLKDDNGKLEYNNEKYQVLKELVIPDDVKKIKNRAFLNFNQLYKLTIHSGVEEIAPDAFYGCEKIIEIYNLSNCEVNTYRYPFNIDHDVYIHKSLDEKSNLIKKDGLVFIYRDSDYYLYDIESVGNIVLPESVECDGIIIDGYIIDYNAFSSCNLKNISIPNSIKGIKAYNYYFKNIKSNCIGRLYYIGNDENPYLALLRVADAQYPLVFKDSDNCKIILNNAFENSNFNEIELSENIIYIGEYAFANNFNLGKLVLNANIKEISPFLCYKTSIKELIIPSTVLKIGNSAFSQCNKLKTITLPNSIKYIGNTIFYECSSLETINFDGTIDEWNNIEKDEEWNGCPNNIVVKCSDGDIEINHN